MLPQGDDVGGIDGNGRKERDERDCTRKIALLRQAEDAVLIDSSDMTIEEVVKAIIDNIV